MSTKELRKAIIEKIGKTEDHLILEEVSRLLEMDVHSSDFFELTEEQKRSIEMARSQIKSGEFLTESDANANIDLWLKK